MKILYLIAVFTMLSAGTHHPAAAETGWRPLRDDGRVVTELGPARTTSATTREATIRRTFRTDDERAYAIDTLELDCTKRTYRYLDIVIYDRDGDVMHRYHLSDQPAAVPAASYLADALRMVCGTGLPK